MLSRFAPLAAACLIAGGCATKAIHIDPRFDPPYRLTTHLNGGGGESSDVIESGSDRARAVEQWLRAHADGWSASLVTYVPQTVIQNDDFNLNLLGSGHAVLNVREGASNASQAEYVREIEGPDLAALQTALGVAD